MLAPCTPTLSTGPCPPTVAGPYAAWMPRKSLHGRTCGVSRDGGRARALQRSGRQVSPSTASNGQPCIRSTTAVVHSELSAQHVQQATQHLVGAP
ncbi:hypothetical protein FCG19_15250 [Xanthomonas hortorum pv. vitians]|nr:hypothetical protein [Xanthomonas hortorum pv. vitians]NMI36088.1 hypothetical protein [Xanthomonas hortorum pv. vitians]